LKKLFKFMSIFTNYTLRCTNCNRVEYKESFDNIDDLLYYSAKDGWIRKKVENGSEWDFCPKCANEEINKNK